MPKQVFKLPGFSKGIIGNASPRDIPEDGMSYGENVDSRVRGRIEGIKGDDTVNASYDARVMGAVLGDDKVLIGQDASKQFKKYDVEADTVTSLGSATTNFARSVVPINKEIICSMTTSFRGDEPADPKWVGEVEGTPFGVGSAGYVVADAECKSFAKTQEFSDISPFITLGHTPDVSASDEPAIFSGSGSVFESSKKYFYAVSLIYDGYQESPLITGYNNGEDKWAVSPSNDSSRADLCLRVGFSSGDFPKRVTGFNLYRAEAPSTDDDSPTSDYYLVKHIDNCDLGGDDPIYRKSNTTASGGTAGSTTLSVNNVERFLVSGTINNIKVGDYTYRVTNVDNGASELTLNSPLAEDVASQEEILIGFNSWTDNDAGNGYPSGFSASNTFHIFIRDTGSTGATYEDNTGFPDTLESTSIKYTIATPYSGYLFVGGAKKDGIPDAEKYIFRSQPKTYSIIDWSNDFTILPERPVALSGFNGRVYAFSRTSMYRINPLTLDVEDSYSGVGALNENMVVSTNYGMFHADNNNIYHNTGTVSNPIGDSILTMQDEPGLGWQELNKTTAGNEHYASMAFDPINKRLLIFAESSGTDTICWAWDVIRERWDLYTDFEIPSTTAIGPDGVLYATTGDSAIGFDLVSLFTSSTRKNWKVRSKDFDLGSDSGDFWGYDIQGYGEGNFNIKYAKDGGTLTDQGTSTVDGLRKTTVSSADKKMKSIQVQAESAATSDTLDNITVQYRPQVIQE